MDDPELTAKFEDELLQLVSRMHAEGLRYETIQFMFREQLKTLELQAHCENWSESFTGAPTAGVA